MATTRRAAIFAFPARSTSMALASRRPGRELPGLHSSLADHFLALSGLFTRFDVSDQPTLVSSAFPASSRIVTTSLDVGRSDSPTSPALTDVWVEHPVLYGFISSVAPQFSEHPRDAPVFPISTVQPDLSDCGQWTIGPRGLKRWNGELWISVLSLDMPDLLCLGHQIDSRPTYFRFQ